MPDEAPIAAPFGGESLELLLMAASIVVALAGIAVAMYFFLRRPGSAAGVAARVPWLYRFLVHKGYVDEIYDAAIVAPVVSLAHRTLWRGVDVIAIDGAVTGIGTLVRWSSAVAGAMQTGSMRVYATWVLTGVVLILAYYVWR